VPVPEHRDAVRAVVAVTRPSLPSRSRWPTDGGATRSC
jgi:hypothetical protein